MEVVCSGLALLIVTILHEKAPTLRSSPRALLAPEVQPLPDVVEVSPRSRISHLIKHLSYRVVVDRLSIGIVAARDLPIILEGQLLERFDVERLLLPRFELDRGRPSRLMEVLLGCIVDAAHLDLLGCVGK